MSLDNWNPETDPQPSGNAGETEPRLPVAEAMEELLAELLSSEEAGGGPACGAPGPGGQPAEPDGADDWLEPAEDDTRPVAATGPAVDDAGAGAVAAPEDWSAAEAEPVVGAGGVEAAAAACELGRPEDWREAAEPETDELEALPAAAATVEPREPEDLLEAAVPGTGKPEAPAGSMEPAIEAAGVEEPVVAVDPGRPEDWLEAAEPDTDEPEAPAGSMEPAIEAAGVEEPVAAVELGRPGDRVETAEDWPAAVERVIETGSVDAAATAAEPGRPEDWLETAEPETDEPEAPAGSMEPAIEAAGVEEPGAAVELGRPGDRLEATEGWPATVEPVSEAAGVAAAAAPGPGRPEDLLEAVEPETGEMEAMSSDGVEPVAANEPGRPGDRLATAEGWPATVDVVVEAAGVEAAAAALEPGRPEGWLEAAETATLEPARPGDWLEASEPEPVPEAAAREENAAAWPGGWLGLIEPTAAPGLALEASALEDAPASSGKGGARSWLVEESPAGESLEPPDASEWLEPLLEQAGAREVPADLAPSAPEPPLAARAEEWLQPPGGDEWLESLLEQSADAAAGGAPAEMAADDPWSSESGDALWEMPEEAAAAPEAAALGPGAWEPPGQADLPSEAALFVPEGEEAGAPDTPDAGKGAGAEEYPQAAPAAPIAEPLVEPVSVAPPVPAGPSLEEVIAGIDRTIEDAGRAAPDAAGEPQSPARPERIKPGLEDYLVFSLSGTDYALPIHEVTEIGRVPALTRVPNVPHFVRGITNLRGEVIAVLSLPVLLGYGEPPPSPRGRVLFVHLREQSLTTGLMVEDVKGIQRIPAQQLEPVPTFLEDKVTGVLRGVHGRGDRLLNVLHLGHLFELPEIRQLSAQ